MAEVNLSATMRAATGKGPARQSRAGGRIPGIVYGRGMEPRPIEVDRRELLTAYHTDAGLNVLLDIQVDGETILALTKELQRDPVKGTVLHADFIKVDREQQVEVEVPVVLVGSAAGVKEGGVLEQPTNSVLVRCKVTEVPEHLDLDISALNVGDSMRVSDLAEGREFEVLTDPGTVVVSISAPISEAELDAMAADAGIVEEVSDAEAAEAAEAAAEGAAEGAAESAPAEGGEPAGE